MSPEVTLSDIRQPVAPVPEPVDEKTPVSTYNSHLHLRVRDDQPPRPAATRLAHLPIHPRLSIRVPSKAASEPSVVVDPADRAEWLLEPQPDTLFIARRRYARTLELTLVAGISALLAAAAALWLARITVGKNSYAAEPPPLISAMPSVDHSNTTE